VELEDIVKSGADGTLVKLKDVGRAELGRKNQQYVSRDLEAMRV